MYTTKIFAYLQRHFMELIGQKSSKKELSGTNLILLLAYFKMIKAMFLWAS